MRSFSSILLLVIFTAYTHGIGEQRNNASKTQELVSKFNSDDSLARLIAFEQFENEIPPDGRAAFLSDMWDFVQDLPTETNVRLSILAYLTGRSQEQVPWNNHLKEKILASAKSNNSALRQIALNVMIKHKTPDMRDQISTFLNDEDEAIREATIVEISRWPDSKPLLESYIKANEDKVERHNSVSKARFLRNKQ